MDMILEWQSLLKMLGEVMPPLIEPCVHNAQGAKDAAIHVNVAANAAVSVVDIINFKAINP